MTRKNNEITQSGREEIVILRKRSSWWSQRIRKLEKYTFRIYNKLGELIFTTKDQSVGWDGSYKGSTASLGTYVFIVEYQFPGFPMEKKSGTFVLIR